MKKQAIFRFVLLLGLLLLAGLACSAGPLNGFFATPTPSPTNTPTITPSPTSTNTPLPTATPTLTPTPLPTGTAKEEQGDGSIRFVDYDNKYEVIFPAGWTAVSLGADDINKIMSSASKSNPEFEKTLAALKGMDPNVFRIFVFDFQTGHVVNGFTSNVNVTVQNNAILKALPIKTILESTVQSIPQLNKTIKIASSKVVTTSSNLSIGVIETNWTVTTSVGSKVPVYQRLIIFKTPEGAATITLSTPISLQKTVIPDFEQIIDSLKMLSD